MQLSKVNTIPHHLALFNVPTELQQELARVQFLCDQPAQWKFVFADETDEEYGFWKHVVYGVRISENSERVPFSWGHPCPECRSPAQEFGVCSHYESYKCLVCGERFQVS